MSQQTMSADDFFLLGTDLVKSAPRLVSAYDDADGVTAAFNKNVLAVVNRELGADFDADTFEHVAVWDARAEWIEMRLQSLQEQRVHVSALGLHVQFGAGEQMRTEISAKFRREGVVGEYAAAGLHMQQWWSDASSDFAVSLASRAG